MLRLYANENIELPLVECLRAAGHDVALAVEDGLGRDDDSVLKSAVRLKRIVLTHDKDYGTLIFRDAARGVPGVLLIRLSSSSVDDLAKTVVARIAVIAQTVEGHFIVIGDGGTRVTRLPNAE